MRHNDDWNNARREAEITVTDFADYCGCCRLHALKMETGKVQPGPAEWAGLRAMIAERQA